MPFTPWTTMEQIHALLEFVADHDLVANVDPVQYTIRLLLPQGSLLLTHPDLAPHVGSYDTERSSYTWRSADPTMDDLHARLAALVEQRLAASDDITSVYQALRAECGLAPAVVRTASNASRPRLTESWFCCAEPTSDQLGGVGQSAT
jgi:hypothetical protein